VPNSHESRYREVFAVPLPRRPLFPGGIMPVTVHNNKLIKELVEIRRQGCAGTPPPPPALALPPSCLRTPRARSLSLPLRP
jgi:hypothetical protein